MRLFILAAGVLFGVTVAFSTAANERWESRDPSAFVDAVLVLNDDHTYEYLNRTGSCWLDWNDRGKWQESDDGLLILASETQIDWPVAASSSTFDPSVEGIRVTLLNEIGQPIGNAEILLGDGTVFNTTDAGGRAQFSPADVQRVVGRLEWITFVSAAGAGFIRMIPGTNSHDIRLSPRRHEKPRRTHLMRLNATLKQLGGLRITFEPCTEKW